MARESIVQRTVMLAASAAGWTTWRNNTGQAWAGDSSRLPGGSILIRNPRPLHAGLCKGSSDLIGLRPVTVTAAMVGQILAQFVALEVKGPRGRITQEQKRFLEFIRTKGGLAILARSAEDIEGVDSIGGHPWATDPTFTEPRDETVSTEKAGDEQCHS
jgi:hypothetical protein